MLKGVLKDELIEIRDKYGDERKTEIQEVEDEIDIEDLIEEEQCVFTLTRNGYIKRTSASEYTAQSKGGMGKKGITTRDEDTVVDVFTASTHDYILFFTDTGKVYRKKGYQIPESGKAAKGTNIVNIIQVETGERVQAMIHFRDLNAENLFLTMVTRNGTVKRSAGRDAQEPAQQRHPRAEPRRGRRAGERARDGRRAENSDRHARRYGGRL